MFSYLVFFFKKNIKRKKQNAKQWLKDYLFTSFSENFITGSVLASTSSTSSTSARLLNKMASSLAPLPLPCIDALKAWQGSSNLESPTSTLKFSENGLTMSTSGFSEFTGLSDSCGGEGLQGE